MSVMKKAMDQAEGNAEFINKMLSGSQIQNLQHAAQPHLGGHIDIKG
ncbi:YjfB family protein [Cytobacillus oceanisediminis]|nr:YjfB family protein [Cytobacillus oceanisediminis]MDF2037630.1 YjfB family protein [Cytobacillus oceanisediminis]